MKYDFDKHIERAGTGSVKWDLRKEVFGTENVIPMWVADMDFAVAQPITDALKKRTEHPVYGYTYPSPSLIEAIVDRLQRKYNWRVEKEWLVFTPGVIPALSAALRAFTHPGDSVVINDPVYHPFWHLIPDAGCRVEASPLKFDGVKYEMDFDDLKRRFAPPETPFLAAPQPKMMILCSPHNPVGRVWTPDELRKAGGSPSPPEPLWYRTRCTANCFSTGQNTRRSQRCQRNLLKTPSFVCLPVKPSTWQAWPPRSSLSQIGASAPLSNPQGAASCLSLISWRSQP